MKIPGSMTLRAILCATVALLLVFGGETGGLFRSLEAYSWDVRVRLLARPAPSTDQVTIIEMDQSSLEWGERENGLSWPWPRELYGIILDFCQRAGAATVSFDVLFSEPSAYGVEDDKQLAEAGAAFGRLTLAFALGHGKGEMKTWPDSPGFSGSSRTVWNVPPGPFPVASRASFPTPDVIPGATSLGVITQFPDPDGIFRALHPLSFFAEQPAPALFLATYAAHASGATIRHEPGRLVIQPPDNAQNATHPVIIPYDSQGRAILNFRGKAGTHKAYSAAVVIQSELRLREGLEPVLSPETLRGKHVFFGFTAPALLDLRPSPTDGAFSGVELHVTALDNLLANDFFRPLPGFITIPLATILCLMAAYCISRAVALRQMALIACIFLALPGALAWGTYRALYWLPFVPLFLSIFLSLAFTIVTAYATEGRQRRFLKNAFSQYLSPEVINQIIKEPDRLKLGGERRELSIYFSDLAGFSSIAETLSPEALTRLLNEYLSAMTDIILDEGGTIDKYEGDAIIAFWSAPYPQEDHAARALRAALRCQKTLRSLGPHFIDLAGRELTMRVGLNTGPAVVGNMGSRSRFDYTMLGDAVNLASRLEGANKEFGTRTMISSATFEAAGNAFAGRELGRLRVVGRREATRVIEPMWPEEAATRADVLQIFALGLAAFQAGNFAEAEGIFARIASIDPPAAAYCKRCLYLRDNIPADWDGVWELSGK